ncbi:MAG: hypothetical protein IKY78_01655 [Clostridia bacterium]|nr:hypothetical protein [Clostridia bacterium]
MKATTDNGFNSNLQSRISALSDKFSSHYSNKKKPGKKTLIIGFVLIILALAVFSAITLIDENSKTPTVDEIEIDPAVLNSSAQPLSARLVFVFTDAEKTEVLSVMTANFSSENKSFVYSFISPRSVTEYNGTTDTLSGHLAAGGTNQLIHAISAFTGNDYDRYIVGDDVSLGKLFQLLGDTEADIENRISYDHNGVSFIIDEGLQTLTPDMMLKYFHYLISDDNIHGEKLAAIVINCFERLVSNPDGSDFESAIGYLDTNISAQDYSNNKELLRTLPEMKLTDHAVRE